MNTKTKNSGKHFRLSETSETSTNVGKRTGSLYVGQPEQPPPEGDPPSTGTCAWEALSSEARRGCGDTAGRRPGCRGHCRPAGLTGVGTRPRGCRGHGGCWQDRSLQPARQSPSPGAARGSLVTHRHLGNCTHPALPTLSPGALNTLSCRKPSRAHLPVPKQAESGENIKGKHIHTLCLFEDSSLFLHFQWHFHVEFSCNRDAAPPSAGTGSVTPALITLPSLGDPLSSGNHWVWRFSAGLSIFESPLRRFQGVLYLCYSIKILISICYRCCFYGVLTELLF